MEIKIGFRFSKQHESLGRKYWKTYEVVGSSYGWMVVLILIGKQERMFLN
jgi:hypothetical protein